MIVCRVTSVFAAKFSWVMPIFLRSSAILFFMGNAPKAEVLESVFFVQIVIGCGFGDESNGDGDDNDRVDG